MFSRVMFITIRRNVLQCRLYFIVQLPGESNVYEMLLQCPAKFYPGFLDLRLFDMLYQEDAPYQEMGDAEKVMQLLQDGPQRVKTLQSATKYKSRSQFLKDIINPLLEEGTVIRQGNLKSPASVLVLCKKDATSKSQI